MSSWFGTYVWIDTGLYHGLKSLDYEEDHHTHPFCKIQFPLSTYYVLRKKKRER